tara:strand:+ start:1780 stop:3117 length:1338 start_codon:yes stop_codon:yes gene_type:complete
MKEGEKAKRKRGERKKGKNALGLEGEKEIADPLSSRPVHWEEDMLVQLSPLEELDDEEEQVGMGEQGAKSKEEEEESKNEKEREERGRDLNGEEMTMEEIKEKKEKECGQNIEDALMRLQVEDILACPLSFIWAADNGHVDVMKYLVSRGLSVQEMKAKNCAALRLSCRSGHAEAVKYLLSPGLTIDELRSRSNASLISSIRKGHVEVLRLLLTAGIPFDDVRENNNLAFRWACRDGYADMVSYLIEEGLMLDDIRSCGNEPLKWSSENGHVKVVRRLLQAGLGREDILNSRAYHHALRLGRFDVVYQFVCPRMCCLTDEDIRKERSFRECILSKAARVDLLQLLILRGRYTLKQLREESPNCLLDCIRRKKLDSLRLLTLSCKFRMSELKGTGCLSIACRNQDVDMVRFLCGSEIKESLAKEMRQDDFNCLQYAAKCGSIIMFE